MIYVPFTLCFKLRSFYIEFCYFLSISNVTVMNLFLYVTKVNAFFAYFFKFFCLGNTLGPFKVYSA